jgi:hypothetical protein
MRKCSSGDDLFGEIATFNALRIAARKAVLGKRKKPGASAFFANLERELLHLERELREGTYVPGLGSLAAGRRRRFGSGRVNATRQAPKCRMRTGGRSKVMQGSTKWDGG